MASPHPDRADIVVVGGGLIGCSVAFELVSRGLQAIVIEPELSAGPASWAGAGMLSPVGELAEHEDFLALARASLAAYPAFVERITDITGRPFEFGISGKIEVAFHEPGTKRLEAMVGQAGVRTLSVAEAHALEPAVSRDIVAAIHFPDDALVDNRALRNGLQDAAQRRGAQFMHAPVLALLTRQGEVTGVQCPSGTILSDIVVLAAGAWSAQVAGLPRPLPVLPVRGQMIALLCRPRPFGAILQSERCYMIPRAAGRVLVGATVERGGFDARTTAEGRRSLHQAALALVPVLARAQLTEHWMGFRPGTPDDLPLLGRDPDIKGLFHATGHFRNGILLTPITGTLIADLIEGRAPAFALESFRPDRFSRDTGRGTRDA